MAKLNYIDLFAGAGGLSEGFVRAGFNPIAHVEMNKDACDTIKTRTAYHWLKENGKVQEYYDYLKSENKNKEELWKKVPENLINSVINKEISNKTVPDIFNSIDNELGNKQFNYRWPALSGVFHCWTGKRPEKYGRRPKKSSIQTLREIFEKIPTKNVCV